jgi:hypothetical protein
MPRTIVSADEGKVEEHRGDAWPRCGGCIGQLPKNGLSKWPEQGVADHSPHPGNLPSVATIE